MYLNIFKTLLDWLFVIQVVQILSKELDFDLSSHFDLMEGIQDEFEFFSSNPLDGKPDVQCHNGEKGNGKYLNLNT